MKKILLCLLCGIFLFSITGCGKKQIFSDYLIEQANEEIKILEKYLPEQLSSEEVIQIIDDAFNTLNPTSAKDMGLIMKEVTPKLKGKCDMSMVSSIIKEKLNNI